MNSFNLLGLLLASIIVVAVDADGDSSLVQLQSLSRDFLTFLGQQALSWNLTDPSYASQDLTCLNQLAQLDVDLRNSDLWAVNMYDSWGKAPSGLLFGNVFELGSFDQCRRVSYANYFGSIEGQHCTLIIDLRSLQLPVGSLWYGICVPAVCRPALVGALSNAFLGGRGSGLWNDLNSFCYGNEEKPFSALSIVAIVLFSCYGFVLIAATALEYLFTVRKSTVPSYVQRFSIYTNTVKIFHLTPPSKSKSEVMDCVNGIRALAMLGIIVHHVVGLTYLLPNVNFVLRMEYEKNYLWAAFHRLGGIAVDIFLLLSGMLLTMKVLRELDSSGKLNVIQLYLQRFLRITPAFAAAILFAMAFIDHLGEGFLYKNIAAQHSGACSQSWWSALFYVQNYVHYDSLCLPHTWYLAVDMQLYILSPLILIPLWKYGKRFIPVISMLALLSISCVFATFLYNDFRLNIAFSRNEMEKKTYHPTHARMSVWLFGVMFGYLLHKTKSSTIRLPKPILTLGWSLALGILILVAYTVRQVYVGDFNAIPVVVDAFYESLHRSLIALSVAWIIFVSINGQGGIVNRFLSSALWQPLARLSYSMYLLHMLILTPISMNIKVPLYFSAIDVVFGCFGLTGLSALVSIVWSAAFEYPFFGLEKKLIKSK
ncbi:nose resistant to fluoxetine protein 6-like [Uranotaenia lowii]|uniref:nose resistant to fluoxetine protein 6-like n=1 Tax=Uranotaenia lowii TaxID=190385 RepID=UPI0024799899|nr:nose resistant to fluoxetine protein 6-like [Uranotaenia lowii]